MAKVMQGFIKLVDYRGVWMVDMSHASNAAEVLSLFGTHLIPTPFMGEAGKLEALRQVERMYPNDEVEIG